MGDQIDITSWSKHHDIFYRMSGSGMTFQVKASGRAAIGLAKSPGPKCDYWIIIGDRLGHNIIIRGEQVVNRTSTPNLITMTQYTPLWITWDNNLLCLGRTKEARAIISCTNEVKDLNYVTFSVKGEHNRAHWRFELPPSLEKPIPRPLTGGEPQWVSADVQLPKGALIGGFEKEALYIIRAKHRGSLTPGKFVPSLGLGYVSWGGESNETSEFEVLVGYNCKWVPTQQAMIPVGAVIGGYSEVLNETLYIGRVHHDGHIIPGKVQPSHRVCYFAYKQEELPKKEYEILVVPQSDANNRKVLVSKIEPILYNVE